jgi:two-component system response regulator HydG
MVKPTDGENLTGQSIIGTSIEMSRVKEIALRVSICTANVLITGESGTGKEMIARFIHQNGPRALKPFIAINCSAIPEALLESELFGHARGSFTGAVQSKRGLFEEAEGGTLLLDEIGDMSVSLQSKLLRVVQERRVRGVGENFDRAIDIRIISATHQDLKAAIKAGTFREDLFYRLSVIPIELPPLRARSGDIPLFATFFLKKYALMNQTEILGFSPQAISKLEAMRWSGNVRELENSVERAIVFCQTKIIEESDFATAESKTSEIFYDDSEHPLTTIDHLEKSYIQMVLRRTGDRKDEAAQILGINRRTLYRKEKEFDRVSCDVPMVNLPLTAPALHQGS